MKIKNSKGFTGIDIGIAIVAIMVFSGLIFSLMYNHYLENVKLQAESLAMIYLTETLENIGIADYNDVTQENSANFIPQDSKEGYHSISLQITTQSDITKKVKATVSYKIVNKEYQYSIERIKIKE